MSAWPSFTLFAAALLLSPTAFALDCPKAPQTARALLATAEVQPLVKQLDDEILKFKEWARSQPEGDWRFFDENQAKWEESLCGRLDRESAKSLVPQLELRADALRLADQRLSPAETPEPEVIEVDATLAYRWVRVSTPHATLLRYPQLVRADPATHLAAVNATVRKEALEMVGNYTSTLVTDYSVFRFEVLPSGQGFFHLKRFDESWGCWAGCAHPSSANYAPELFDLKSGAEPLLRIEVLALKGVKAATEYCVGAEGCVDEKSAPKLVAAARKLAQPQLAAHWKEEGSDADEDPHGLDRWNLRGSQCAATAELTHCYAQHAFDTAVSVPLRELAPFRHLLAVNDKALEQVRREGKAGILSAETMKTIEDCVTWVRGKR